MRLTYSAPDLATIADYFEECAKVERAKRGKLRTMTQAEAAGRAFAYSQCANMLRNLTISPAADPWGDHVAGCDLPEYDPAARQTL